MTEGIFVGLDIRKFMKDNEFETCMIAKENEPELFFKDVVRKFRGNCNDTDCKRIAMNKLVKFQESCFFGRLDCEAVLNPISGQVFDEGHDESGVVHSAEWHDDDWLDDGIREAWLLCFVRMVVFQKFLPWLRAK
ncbi:uncharacterized protein TNCV_212951 [Trichonephila clavipes]|nr:uncharacterized protein TNCV_212951 [Trichonephila clavipes]